MCWGGSADLLQWQGADALQGIAPDAGSKAAPLVTPCQRVLMELVSQI